MPTIPTTASSSTASPATSITTAGGITHVDLNFAAAMTKGSGSIFVTDGAVQTVIDRATGQATLRVVGATVTREIPLSEVQVGGTHVSFDVAGLASGLSYNIYMGAGALLAGGQAHAGMTVPGAAAFALPAADIPPPPLSATFSFENTTLKAGTDIYLLVTFSEDVTGLDPAAFVAQHAAVRAVNPTEDGKTWEVVLKASDSIASLDNVVRLDLSQVQTSAGVRGSGTAVSPSYAVDTVVDAWVTGAIVGADRGPFDDDGITNATSTTMSGELSGGLDTGESVEVSINGDPVDPAAVRVSKIGETWTWEYDPARAAPGGPAFDEGDNTVVIRVVGAGGHSSTETVQTVFIDTLAPEITLSPDEAGDVAVDAPIVIEFSEPVYWKEEESDADLLYLYRTSDDDISRIRLGAENFSEDGRTLTLWPSQLGLEPGKLYAIELPANLTDIAGNGVADNTIEFRTGGGDTTAPFAVHASVDREGSFGVGEKLTFRIYFNEEVRVVGDAIPSIGLSGGLAAQYTALGESWIEFSYTVREGDNASALDIVDIAELSGTVEDLSGNLLDSTYIEFELQDGSGYGAEIDIDTTAPDALVTLALADDTGISASDGLTRETTLAGSGAEANAQIRIMDGNEVVGLGTSDDNGDWTADFGYTLPDGEHTFTVRQVDQAGNISADSAPITFTVDRSRPATPNAPVLDRESDTGALHSDGITSDTTPTFTGTGAPANSEIALYVDEVEVGRAATDDAGAWSLTIGAGKLASDRGYSVAVKHLDRAGNMSFFSDSFDLVVDTSAPAALAHAPTLEAASDSGAFNDGITNDTTPTFSGTGAEAGGTLVLFAGEREIGRTVADAAGNWHVEVAAADALDDGDYAVTARQLDAAGNLGAASGAFSLVIDTEAPTLIGADTKLLQREFQLKFDEEIVFLPNGQFDLKLNSLDVGNFRGNSGGNWYTSNGTGGEDSVLNFKIALSGLFNIHMNNDAIQDIAGNVALIGTRDWIIDLLGDS